jgi:T-complex protein 11
MCSAFFPASLEGRIKEVMHKAFWDVLAESLKEDPPDYTHALVLLKEVKQAGSYLFMYCGRII